MGATKTKKKKEQPIITIKIVYGGGNGVRDAYRLLAKKVLEEMRKCERQSISELAPKTKFDMDTR